MLHLSSILKAPGVRAGLVLLALGGLAACRDEASDGVVPTAPEASAARGDASPFYYYFDQKIPLRADPTRMVVKGGPGTAAAARAILAGSGVAVVAEEAIGSAPGHTVLRLGGGLTPGLARAAREQLKRAERGRFVSQVYRTPEGNDLVLLDRLIVQFRRGVSDAQVSALADSLGMTVERRPVLQHGFTYYWLRYPEDSAADPLAVAAALNEDPRVEWADPDAVSNRVPDYVPTDPLYSNQWTLKNYSTSLNGVPVDINVEPAWDLTLGSSTVRVAVIDLGVDAANPDIAAAMVGSYDAYAGLYSGEDGYHPCLSPCVYYYSNGTYWKTGDTHGTEVAGIIAARHNSAGVAGIAPNVQLLAVRAGRNKVMGTNSQLTDAINWAWNTGQADVLNNSWSGGSSNTALTAAINAASSSGRGGKGAVVVFSAGNDNSGVSYPATLGNVVSVGAIDRGGALASYTNRGPEIDVVAPSSDDGWYVSTTDLVGSWGSAPGDYSSTFGGTSAAAPMVSGAAALMISRDPSLPGATVRERLRLQADPWGTNTGGGKLNVRRALDVPSLSLAISGPRYAPYQYSTGSCTWTATHTGGQPPYSYVWKRDGNWLGSGQSYTMSGPIYNSSMILEVTMTDALGSTKTASLGVYATTSSYTCF